MKLHETINTINPKTELEFQIDEMLAEVLGTRQVGYTKDVQVLIGKKAPVTVWRWTSTGKWPKPIYIEGRPGWLRPTIRTALLKLFGKKFGATQ
ncbi:MAG: hypothetical protein RPU14_03095 [Candidatus Sedimenticola sp. (ex Thyasira tokunagai)]